MVAPDVPIERVTVTMTKADLAVLEQMTRAATVDLGGGVTCYCCGAYRIALLKQVLATAQEAI
jgi:hypothetical protein